MHPLQRLERALAIAFAALLLSALLVWGISLFVQAGPPRAITAATSTMPAAAPAQKAAAALEPHTYIQVVDGCGPYFQGECLNVRSGPGLSYPSVAHLRDGMVLEAGQRRENDGHTWYKVVFDESVRYPERISNQWWIAGDYVRIFQNDGPQELAAGVPATSTKRIDVDLTLQKLTAYDGKDEFMDEAVSTGLDGTPTPRGYFRIFKKTPSRYMQGPLPGISEQYYDLPGVPWDLYFTHQGAAIHGAYWHDKFGDHWSHGCVNLPVAAAEKLYEWADLGTPVYVHD